MVILGDKVRNRAIKISETEQFRILKSEIDDQIDLFQEIVGGIRDESEQIQPVLELGPVETAVRVQKMFENRMNTIDGVQRVVFIRYVFQLARWVCFALQRQFGNQLFVRRFPVVMQR